MAASIRSLLTPVLDRAVSSEFGVALNTSDPITARRQLYGVRNEVKNPDYDELVLTIREGQVWILRSSQLT